MIRCQMDMRAFLIFCTVFITNVSTISAQTTIIGGTVVDEKTGKPVANVNVRASGSSKGTITNTNGAFLLELQGVRAAHLYLSHLAFYTRDTLVKTAADTVRLQFALRRRNNLLDTITVSSGPLQPETLVGNPNYSIIDFDFLEDFFVLLTLSDNGEYNVRLFDAAGKQHQKLTISNVAGKPLELYHDYEGYPDLVCMDSVFRIDLLGNTILLATIPRHIFNRSIKPVSDTAGGQYFFNDQVRNYPSFTYYHKLPHDTVATRLRTITDTELLRTYRMEYYFLPPRMQLEARRIAREYQTEPQMIAAVLSGFTGSKAYSSLYAPLFVISDTTVIFDHYRDFVFRYDRENKLCDSSAITYHHADWKDWKKQLIFDEARNDVYALFSRNGHKYLRRIDSHNGKVMSTYTLKNYSGDRLRISDGYVYYTYRPFSSTQQKFLYREKIE